MSEIPKTYIKIGQKEKQFKRKPQSALTDKDVYISSFENDVANFDKITQEAKARYLGVVQ